MKTSQRSPFIARHARGFKRVGQFPERMRFGRRHALPQRALHIVLKEQAGNRQLQRENSTTEPGNRRSRRRTAAGELAPNQRLRNLRMRELRNRVRREPRQPVKVVEHAAKSFGLGSGSVDDLRMRKLLRKRGFVIGIAPAAVIRKQRDFVIFPEPPQDVVRANLAASIDREELASLDPQHSHSIFPRPKNSNGPNLTGSFESLAVC
jgi:hypothetical protein